jgi:hypothetical protein
MITDFPLYTSYIVLHCVTMTALLTKQISIDTYINIWFLFTILNAAREILL